MRTTETGLAKQAGDVYISLSVGSVQVISKQVSYEGGEGDLGRFAKRGSL
ncbi:hypothetical protein [Stygiolobus caldivivus]|nr:hypothetical protein [Stygiolobus caldivivus]